MVIAHRQEIVIQISLSLAKHGVRHRIIGPDNVVKLVNRIHMEELGKSYYSPQAPVAVAGVDTLIRRNNIKSWADSVTLWVQDECFAAGTLVDGTPIEKLKIGDQVTSFDERTGRFEKKKVSYVFKNRSPAYMVRLKVGQRVINVTPNHPFYTKRGWVEAGELTVRDRLYATPEWVMVDGIDVFRSDSPFVYNLEVGDFHTYLVEGVVVHNCHHVLQKNKWGSAAEMFPNARGLGVTATPCRADGKGLGFDNDGLFHTMVSGPGMRDLIRQGFLSEYRVFCPTSNFDKSELKLGADGDYTLPSTKAALSKSTIVGDVVASYLKFAPGKLGITFATDLETAALIAERYRAAGVKAELISSKSSDQERTSVLRKFRKRDILQLVNVDLVGEGFDVPGVEVVSMARPTKSFALFAQQFGRALRPVEGKVATIIDHVGNIVDIHTGAMNHGLPDAPRVFTLDRRERRERDKDPNIVPIRACPNCASTYERLFKICPYCGYTPPILNRSGPEFVDGDLTELDPITLARMRGEVVDMGMTVAEYLAKSGAGALGRVIAAASAKRFLAKQEAQNQLRASMAQWAGYHRAAGRPDTESYRLFYFLFGMDVLSAQALGRKDAEALKFHIDNEVSKL